MSHTIPDIATMLGVAERTVQVWIADGELRAVTVSRSRHSQRPRLRVLDADLQAFLAGRAVQQDTVCPPRRRRKAAPIKQYV